MRGCRSWIASLPAVARNDARNNLLASPRPFPYTRPMTSDAFTPAARMRLAKRELLILCARIGYNP